MKDKEELRLRTSCSRVHDYNGADSSPLNTGGSDLFICPDFGETISIAPELTADRAMATITTDAPLYLRAPWLYWRVTGTGYIVETGDRR